MSMEAAHFFGGGALPLGTGWKLSGNRGKGGEGCCAQMRKWHTKRKVALSGEALQIQQTFDFNLAKVKAEVYRLLVQSFLYVFPPSISPPSIFPQSLMETKKR